MLSPLVNPPPAGRPGPTVFWLAPADRDRFFPPSPSSSAQDDRSRIELDPTAVNPDGLRVANPEVVVTEWSTPPLETDWLESPACRLRYVCHLGGTVRRVVPRLFLERGGLVTNWGDAASTGVAEHALLLALAALRDLDAWRASLARAGTAEAIRTRTLTGKKIGLHGFGRIARKLRDLLRPFGGRVRAFSPGVPSKDFVGAGVEMAASLEDLFADSQVLFECEALTPATAQSVTRALLERLPTDAVFVNVGRGGVVDESALVDLALRRRIRVAVDVLQQEPASFETPLCRVAGVVVSPHIGGPTREEYPAVGIGARENLRRYAAGEPLENQVTLETYDRST